MHIAVCVKHVPDPEAPWSQFAIDGEALRVVPMAGVRWLMSPFDEQALEAALRVRDARAATRITVVAVGDDASRATLRHGLAMGADDAVLVGASSARVDEPFATSQALAAAVRRLGDPPLVLAGRQSGDRDAGVVGSLLAEILDRPVVTLAASLEPTGDGVRVDRVVDDGFDVVDVTLPAVVTVTNELGRPRSPSLRDTMRAARKPIVAWSSADHGVDAPPQRCPAVRRRLFVPPARDRCELVCGATPEAQASLLVARLREAGMV